MCLAELLTVLGQRVPFGQLIEPGAACCVHLKIFTVLSVLVRNPAAHQPR